MENLSAAKVRWFRRQLGYWGRENLRDFQWRRTTDAYAIFVAEFLLQKTGAVTVAPVYEKFLKQYPTVDALAAAPVAKVDRLLQPLGLRFRAERMVESAGIICEEFGGKVPATEAELLKLPGVGKYTARCILANAYSQRAAILDTNVARILERFFGLEGDRVKSRCKLLWGAADGVAPNRDVSKWNLTLLDFGAAVCTAKNPGCGECPLRERCDYIN
ncbi:MAG: A/G-specific adenine glycosylase [Cyanobacteriota bacterium]|nr:A/G-specific adenine glycosylase [Cyanobacteriota bacterium]